MEILKSFALQILLSVGVLVIFGLLISVCRRAFCRATGRTGNKILLATGIVGTPIHELSHALMCLIFGHKIKQIKLYQPSSTDGTLGFVAHSYNKKNIYHQIGNFFIGIAPIICGSGVLFLLMHLLTPELSLEMWDSLGYASDGSVGSYFEFVGRFLTSLFDASNFANASWWIFIVLAVMISSHMELSGPDIKSGAIGFSFIAILLLIFDALLYLISPYVLDSVTSAMVSFALPVAGFLTISVIFLLILLIFALIVKGIASLFKK